MKIKTTMIVIFILAPILCIANPSPFGLEIGKTTLKEYKSKYKECPLGICDIGIGFRIDPKEASLEGVEKIFVFFSQDNNILVDMIVYLNKNEFYRTYEVLKKKYKLKEETTSSSGDKFIYFTESDVIITLDAPQSSSIIHLQYFTTDLHESIKKRKALIQKDASSKL